MSDTDVANGLGIASSTDGAWQLTPFDDWMGDTGLLSSSTDESSAPSSLERSISSPMDTMEEEEDAEEAFIARGALSPTPINTHSSHDASYICPSSAQEFAWYFAIGSMINPTSLSLRKLHPLESYPGILRGWRLVFRGDCGMASVLPIDSTLPSMSNHTVPRNDFHGVLHRLTREQMNKLDVIENSYEKLEVYVECYDGYLQKATVYKMSESKLDPSKPDALPSERYLDIISRGCVHFGIKKEYISWLRSHRCIARKRPSDYKKIPVHQLHQSGRKHLQMTAQELVKFDGRPIEEGEEFIEEEWGTGCVVIQSPPFPSPPPATVDSSSIGHQNGSDSCCSHQPGSTQNCQASPSPSPTPSPSPPAPRRFYPLRIAVNKKILEWIGDLREPLLANTYQFIRENFGGTDCTHSYTCVFFEPRYPIVSKYSDMSLEHRAMVEDIFAEKVLNPNVGMREWKLVGFLSTEEQKESQQQGQAKLRVRRMGLTGETVGGMARGASDGGLSSLDTDGLEPEDDSSLISNMFLSLSMEDHSGASSTCFAFCCAGALPFDAQRVREQQLQNARTPGGTRVIVGTKHSKRLLKGLIPERKRRHSIGNVGLHQMHHDQSQQNHPHGDHQGHGHQHDTATSAGEEAKDRVGDDDSFEDSAATSSSSRRKLFLTNNGSSSRKRASSICTGVLASSHTPTNALSQALSPRKRIESFDDSGITSPQQVAALPRQISRG